ncbi:unnamed protein product [Pylaiella littoralis]
MSSTGDRINDISTVAKDYYDSDNAFNFYRQVWGGEHIHVGLYTKLDGDDAELEGVPRITKASSMCTDKLLSLCFSDDGATPPSKCTLMDMGSGYGGTARVAAKKFGCKVVCINVASRENEINAGLSKDAKLDDKVIIPGEKSFFETGMPDGSCDVVTSQDALLHAGSERHRALAEAARVLKPGGRMVFTDIMQSEEAEAKDLQEVYQRIHLDDMGTPKAYEEWGKTHGLEFVEFIDMTPNIEMHYGSVREVLVSRRGNLEGVEDEFVDNMARGLDAWTSAAGRDLIRWGFLVFTKRAHAGPTSHNVAAIAATAEGYYNSDNAFNFYRQVWGGEHIHVGLYTKLDGDDAKLEGVPRITKASSMCTDKLLSLCFPGDAAANADADADAAATPPSKCTLMDMGSGYGGTARVAATKLGCKVVCINVAARENGVNAALTKAAGLEEKVIIPGEKSFFETGMPDGSCDVVTSQDALLHAGSERHMALAEASRVLKPGGRMVFTDIMQSEEAEAKDLQEVYQRIHLDDMGTPKGYEEWGKSHGLEFVEFVDMTPNIEMHYGSVREVLVSRRGSLEGVEDEFVDNMARGLDAWTSAAGRDLIRWGFLVFTKRVSVARRFFA